MEYETFLEFVFHPAVGQLVPSPVAKSSSPLELLEPNLGLGLLNPLPPDISILCQPSPIPAFHHPLESLSTASNHLPLGLPTGLLPSMYPSSAFLGTLSSSSRDPPNEVFSICYPCLTPFPCISYKFLDESCLVIVHYLTQVHRLSVRQ